MLEIELYSIKLQLQKYPIGGLKSECDFDTQKLIMNTKYKSWQAECCSVVKNR